MEHDFIKQTKMLMRDIKHETFKKSVRLDRLGYGGDGDRGENGKWFIIFPFLPFRLKCLNCHRQKSLYLPYLCL